MKKVKLLLKIFILTMMLCCIMPLGDVKAQDTAVLNTQILSNMNALRAQVGAAPLTIDASLTEIAKVRAQEASTTWSHTRPNGTQGISMLPSNKWRGENLAYVQYGSFGFSEGEQSAAAGLMFANLKASPTHYKNMVFGNFKKVGIYTYVMQVGSGYKLTTAFMFTN